jgi:hypothetical protein
MLTSQSGSLYGTHPIRGRPNVIGQERGRENARYKYGESRRWARHGGPFNTDVLPLATQHLIRPE